MCKDGDCCCNSGGERGCKFAASGLNEVGDKGGGWDELDGERNGSGEMGCF